MQEKEFNLIDEQWIPVILPSGEIKEVSLMNIFENAENYVDIAGETPAQYIALLRLLLAVANTVRAKVGGFDSPDAALDCWQKQWEKGKFDAEGFERYFQKWHDRFWLVHPDRPFYQVPSAAYGTACTAAKLHGELLESNNKKKLFRGVDGEEVEKLDNPKTARWLITLVSFDDASLKKKRKDAPSIKPAWAGQLGGVYAHGNSLFETLWLNTIFVNDKGELYGEDKPSWELPELREEERTEIPVPDNLAELFTLQSRRVCLKRENGYTVGYNILGGDFFGFYNAFVEPFTLWKSRTEKGEATGEFYPGKFEESRIVWKSIPYLFSNDSSFYRKPGIEQWLSLLKESGILEESKVISFKVVSFDYGSQSSAIEKCYSDTLSFGASILEATDNKTYQSVILEISKCDKCAASLKTLWNSINTALGKRTFRDVDSESVSANFYHSIDEPFRRFFYNITTSSDSATKESEKALFEKILLETALRQGQNLVLPHSSDFFRSRKGENGTLSIPGAFLRYKRKIYALFPAAQQPFAGCDTEDFC